MWFIHFTVACCSVSCLPHLNPAGVIRVYMQSPSPLSPAYTYMGAVCVCLWLAGMQLVAIFFISCHFPSLSHTISLRHPALIL